VFGVDSETLEEVVSRMLASRGWRLAVVERGTGGGLASAMERQTDVFAGSRVLPERIDAPGLAAAADHVRRAFEARVGLGVVAWRESDREMLLFHLVTPDQRQDAERSYGGPPEDAAQLAISMALDFLRRRLA
jgi:hypothetical protein